MTAATGGLRRCGVWTLLGSSDGAIGGAMRRWVGGLLCNIHLLCLANVAVNGVTTVAFVGERL